MRLSERWGLLAAFTALGLFWGAWAASLPALRVRVAATDGELGLALGAVAVAALPVMRLAGRLVDRYGARWTLPGSLVLFAAVVPAPGYVRSLPALVVCLVLVGIGTGALDLVVNAATAAWERLEDGHLMSPGHGAFSLGVLAGASLAGAAREAGAGPPLILTTVGLLVLVVAAVQPAYRKAPGADQDHEPRRRRLPAVLLVIGVLITGSFLAEDAIQSWSALHLERGLGATPAVSGLGPGLFAGSMAVGRLCGGLLQRRYPENVLVGTAAAVLSAGALVVALAPGPAVALVGLVVAGAGTSILAPVLYSAVGRRAAPGRQGADLATVTSVGYVGFVGGPPLVGAVSAATSLPFALGSLSVVAAAIAVGGALLLSGRMDP